MANRVLTDEQIAHFIDQGYVKLEGAFPREKALAAQDFLWERLAERGVGREDRATWTEPMVHLREVYDDDVFTSCMTERLEDAIEEIVGRDRWADRGKKIGWGWWPVNFALGADKPWDVPTGGWHWDGIQFRHRVTAPDQGLLLLPHLSSVAPQGGGTLVAAGSHKIVARFLAAHPDGIELNDALPACSRAHPWLAELTQGSADGVDRVAKFMDAATTDELGTELRVVETTSEPGDVWICHPFLYHAASQNHSGTPRFMCNRTTPLKSPMALDRPDGDYSPVEISIREALAV
ncbi:hypothetical protein CCAX7_41290 [Capsulimonas corticalis]|uniref:Uncharacterized protein n=1 Tax=Capsulimonas corticalis TaxID=2219043 RepID=A0A402D653_9BACT|nr:phytanoyl-CoA dioxygenase family protein [Capsulimonas corticalis]BDI32078.1 hypothetical protein CCAX7_41290 [Capsulimonas corticalis]